MTIGGLQKGIPSDLKLYANNENQQPEELPSEKKEEDIFKDVGDDTLLAAASGTGFFINKGGILVSNNHVIDSCDKNFVFYEGESYEAKVLGVDRVNDLVLILIFVFLNLFTTKNKKLTIVSAADESHFYSVQSRCLIA